MGKRVPRTHAGGTWTKSQYFNFIRGALRKAATRYPVKHQVLDTVKTFVEGKRHRFEYPCAECGASFKRTEVEVDHIVPAGSLREYEDLPSFTRTLFCEADNLQVLCKPCHKKKTAAERKAKKEAKYGE
jgi:5-methylcytosine-specific restriction endonuclease McrA